VVDPDLGGEARLEDDKDEDEEGEVEEGEEEAIAEREC
jgi:hypothetical protein